MREIHGKRDCPFAWRVRITARVRHAYVLGLAVAGAAVIALGLLRTGNPVTFVSHATDLLAYLSGEVRIVPPPSPAPLPAALAPFAGWTLVRFNH